MSKPESAGGSLESILASIRKSLAEQSTDALSEPAAPPVEPENDAKPRRHRLTQRLAGASEPAPGRRDAASDDLSDLLEIPPAGPPAPAQSASNTTAPSSAAGIAASSAETRTSDASANKDPLWFLTPRAEPSAAPPTQPPHVGTASPAPEPSLTRPEVVRATMPPFFGSTAEMPAPIPPVTATSTPAVTPSLAAGAPMARPVQAPEATVAPSTAPSHLNGQTDAAAGADAARDRTLEAMVLDLLKPMLREWLDQNMPRLVAQALSEEAQRARTAQGDAKKT